MTGILAIVLQIILLLLRAYFSKEDEHEKALVHIKEAQEKLETLATAFEQKIRYSAPKDTETNHLQDLINEEEHIHEPPHSKQ